MGMGFVFLLLFYYSILLVFIVGFVLVSLDIGFLVSGESVVKFIWSSGGSCNVEKSLGYINSLGLFNGIGGVFILSIVGGLFLCFVVFLLLYYSEGFEGEEEVGPNLSIVMFLFEYVFNGNMFWEFVYVVLLGLIIVLFSFIIISYGSSGSGVGVVFNSNNENDGYE